MKMRDIKEKNDKELLALIDETRKQLHDSRIDMRTKKVSNVKQIDSVKKTLARIMTEQRSRELKQEEQNG
jgi:large subunit ribosomal protein L29